jgi:hypothetical protein
MVFISSHDTCRIIRLFVVQQAMHLSLLFEITLPFNKQKNRILGSHSRSYEE